MDYAKLTTFNKDQDIKSDTNQRNTTNKLYSFISNFKSKLGLDNPGTFENLHREAKDVFPSTYSINGCRLDLTKGLSENFQVNHSFSLSKDLNQYSFIAIMAKDKWFLQGNIDGQGTLSSRIQCEHSENLRSKINMQLNNNNEPSMIQIESEYSGVDNTINIKAINFDVLEKTGIFCINYLQSITKGLSIGVEAVLQRPNKLIEDSVLGYVLKYNNPNHIFTMQYQPGVIQSSYWRKAGESTQLATELQLVSIPNPNNHQQVKTDINVGVGAKFVFGQSTLRIMADSKGKVSSVLENRIAPPLSLFLSAELNHKGNTSKTGFGLMFAV